MRWLISSSRWSLVVVGILVLLLAVLATLQYRWIAQLSEAERARLKEGLDQAAVGYCEDFDREIARAYAVFSLDPRDGERELAQVLAERMAEWRSEAVWPELVNALLVIRPQNAEDVALLCFDEQAQSLHRCDWDKGLLPIRHRLRDPGPGERVIYGALPGFVLAIERHGTPRVETPREWRPPRDHLVVRFDLDFIARTLLPRLAETHFRVNGGLPYLLTVSSDDRPGETIYRTATRPSSRELQPDATGTLFGLRSFPGLSTRDLGDPRNRRPPPPGRARMRGGAPPPQNAPPPGLGTRTEEGRWTLTVRHPEGSLELVVSKARRRNMAISLAMLIMLAVTAVLMVASTRRERQLARQQMKFVAAVSHELRTPLTAIRSAGQNLADGIVGDPEGVRKYGRLIEREGRRLTGMIGRVLTFAGIRSGRQIFQRKAVDAAEIVKAALRDSGWILEESRFEVDTEFADDLPRVIGDAAALRQVVSNLIDNATKYAADGRWLGIRVGHDRTQGKGEVHISISDHGSGIPKRELSTVFKPFRRGRDAAASSVPGSGLGLAVVRSVVEAHGGVIDINSPPGGGTTFIVRLPAESVHSTERGDTS